jgi:hypothetical protein
MERTGNPALAGTAQEVRRRFVDGRQGSRCVARQADLLLHLRNVRRRVCAKQNLPGGPRDDSARA